MGIETESKIKQLEKEVAANSRKLNSIRINGGINGLKWKELSQVEREICGEIKTLVVSLHRKIQVIG